MEELLSQQNTNTRVLEGTAEGNPPDESESRLVPLDGEEEEPEPSYVGPGGKDNRTMVYPLYLNRKRTVQQGRKVPTDIAVEEPLVQEIFEACLVLELKAVMEPYKTHPRDWGVFGRVRVELFDVVTLEPLNSEIRTRKLLLRELARQIPKLKCRTEPQRQTQITIQQQLGLAPIPAHLMQQLMPALAPPTQQPQRVGKKGRKKG